MESTADEVKLSLDDRGQGLFYIEDGNEKVGKMFISISDKLLTVTHTEVSEKAQGRGLAKQLLNAMVAYARKQGLMVRALCPYVYAQFKRHPEQYADIWENK